MEITPSPLEWSSDDVANFRSFLLSKTGQRLLPKLAELVPPLFEAGDTNKILIRTGTVRGYQQAIQTLMDLAYPPPTPSSTVTDNYPDLLDDKAWPGTEPLNPTQK